MSINNCSGIEPAAYAFPPYSHEELCEAVLNGRLEIVQSIVQAKDVDVNQCDVNGDTPLLIATRHHHLSIVKFLVLQAGALVNRANANNGFTSLHMAAWHGYEDIITFFVQEPDAKVDITAIKDLMPVHLAAQRGHEGVVKILVDKKPETINQGDLGGSTPLHLAAWQGYLPVVQFLALRATAQVNKGASDGCTPMHMAALEGHLPVLEFLVQKAGANVTEIANRKLLALHMAAQCGQPNVIRFLVQQNRATIDKATDDNMRPLYEVARRGAVESVKVLLVMGANARLCFQPHVQVAFKATDSNQEITVHLLAAAYDPASAARMCKGAVRAGKLVETACERQMQWLRAGLSHAVTGMHAEFHCMILTAAAVLEKQRATKGGKSSPVSNFLDLFIQLPQEMQPLISQALARRVVVAMIDSAAERGTATPPAGIKWNWVAEAHKGRRVIQKMQYFSPAVRATAKHWVMQGPHPMPTELQWQRECSLKRHVVMENKTCCVL